MCDWCERVGEWEGRMGCIRKGSNGNERCKWKIMSWVIKRGGGWGKNGVNERGESEVERSEKVGEWKGIEWGEWGGAGKVC